MSPWEFLLAVCSGYLGLIVGFHVIDTIAENRARDRRVREWTAMILEKKKNKKDWQTQTLRDKE